MKTGHLFRPRIASDELIYFLFRKLSMPEASGKAEQVASLVVLVFLV